MSITEENFNKILSTILNICENTKRYTLIDVIKNSTVTLKQKSYQRTDVLSRSNGIFKRKKRTYNTYVSYIYFAVEASIYVIVESRVQLIEKELTKIFEDSTGDSSIQIYIIPAVKYYINMSLVSDISSKQNLINSICLLKTLLISSINNNQEYHKKYRDEYTKVDYILQKLNYPNPNNFKSLALWEKYCQEASLTDDDMQYKANKIYDNLLNALKYANDVDEVSLLSELSGWEKVDRCILEMNKLLINAKTEEQFQSIGLLGRETIISLAQEVYNKEIHNSNDGIEPSNTDAKKMIDCYITYELSGESNERLRAYSKSAIALANHLVHDRTANGKDASLCLNSVISLVNLIKVVSKHSEVSFP